MTKRLFFSIRLIFLTGLFFMAGDASTYCISSNGLWDPATRPAPVLWPWLLGAGILFFCMLMAIIILTRRVQKKSRALQDEKERHFITTQQAAQNEHLLREIYDNTNDVFFYHDLDGNMKDVNTTGLHVSGYTLEQWRHFNIRDLVPERFTHECPLYLDRLKTKGEDRGYMMIHTANGTEILLEYNNTLIKDALGRPTGVRGIARDITEQQKTRKALKKSEEKYRTILESIEDAYYEVDLAGNVTFFNNSMLRMLGYTAEEIKEKNYSDFVNEQDKKTIFETFNYVYRTGKPVKAFDWGLIRKDKTVCHVETSVSLNLDKNNRPVGFLGIIRDLTARFEGERRRRELEAQLHQSQKLESIGTLAGGIAHDFNNILFPILGYTEMTMEELPQDSHLQDNLQKVITSAQRAKAMVQQILAFSRQGSDEYPEPVQIGAVVKETVKLLKNTFPSTIAIEESISKHTGRVLINLSSFHQVIMNLCTNALHAMEDLPSGRLSITVEEIRVTENNAAEYQNLTVGHYVLTRIADTGKGITPENQDKIFEPYFSTKSQEKGTGLGLSVSYGIVKNAGGSITVKSTPGKGTQFDVFLPVADEGEIMGRDRVDAFSPLPTGSEHILLVDDEHRIVELVRQMIETLGYKVFPRTSSIEALEAFRYDPGRFDLVLTDQTMPNMTGIELAKKIMEIRPDIPIIICTGFSEKVTTEKIKAIGIKAILNKPILNTDMAVTIRSVLDECKTQKAAKEKP